MQSPWIKLSDRLPTEAECPSGRVLVHFIDGHKSDEYLNWGVRSTAFKDSRDDPRYDYWMPIPPIPDQANALVAAHNGEQEELMNETLTPQGQSRSETGATEECQHYVRDGISTHYSDESLSYTVTGTCQKCRAVVERELTDIERKGGPTRQWRIVSAPSPAITRANKARDEQSAPAAEQVDWQYLAIRARTELELLQMHWSLIVGHYGEPKDLEYRKQSRESVCQAIYDAQKAAPSPAQEKSVEPLINRIARKHGAALWVGLPWTHEQRDATYANFENALRELAQSLAALATASPSEDTTKWLDAVLAKWEAKITPFPDPITGDIGDWQAANAVKDLLVEVRAAMSSPSVTQTNCKRCKNAAPDPNGYCAKCNREITENEERHSPPVQQSKEPEWVFDRYHNGTLMAEGARVHASTFESALIKAKALFHDHPKDTFKLRLNLSPSEPAGRAGSVVKRSTHLCPHCGSHVSLCICASATPKENQ